MSTSSKGTTKAFQKSSSAIGSVRPTHNVGSSKKRIPSSSSTSSFKRKVSNGTTKDDGKYHQQHSFSDQGMFSSMSLKNEKAVLLNEEEMIIEFDRQKRRLERLSFVMKLPFIDVEYFFKTYGSEYNTYNLHQLSMVVDLLENHKLKTIQVTEAIWEREDVLDRLHFLVEEYNSVKDSNPGLILVAQKEALILQKELQKKGLKIVELIDKWRKDLSLDYPFRFMEFSNYLIKMRYDLEFVDSCDLSHYIFQFKGHPLLANVPSLYYDNIEKLLEVPDKKNPSLSATVTYPLTKKKLKMADKAMNAERKLNKYEAIILKEEDNERTIKQFLFTLIKKGKFITVLNVSEGEFELTSEQQQKIKGIFNQNPEYVISYFNLHSKVNIEHQFSENKLDNTTSTNKNSEVFIKTGTPKSVSNDKVFLIEEDETTNENTLTVNNDKGYASDLTDDIEFEIIEKKKDQNNYDGSGEETEEEIIVQSPIQKHVGNNNIEAFPKNNEPVINEDIQNNIGDQNPLTLHDSLEENNFQNPYLANEKKNETKEEEEDNTFGYSNPYEDEEQPGDKKDEEKGSDLSNVYGMDNIEAPLSNSISENYENTIETVKLEEDYPENHVYVHAANIEEPILGDPLIQNTEKCPSSPGYSSEEELDRKIFQPKQESELNVATTMAFNELVEDNDLTQMETPRDFGDFSNPYGEDEQNLQTTTPVAKFENQIGTPLMHANIHIGETLILPVGSKSNQQKPEVEISNQESTFSSGSDFSDFEDFSD